jgi:hypothetical protein
MLYEAEFALCSKVSTKHKYSVGTAKNSYKLNLFFK